MQGTLRDWKLELTLNSSATTIETGNKGGSWVAWLRQSHVTAESVEWRLRSMFLPLRTSTLSTGTTRRLENMM